MLRITLVRRCALLILMTFAAHAAAQALPRDLPLPAQPPSAEAWLRTANVLQPYGHSEFVALANPGDRPVRLKRDFGFNAIIVLPPDAHNSITPAADHLTEAQFRSAIDAYRKAGYRLILYTSVMADGLSPEFQSGEIGRKHPDWLQRDPKGNTVNVWGVPWLCPSTGAREVALERCLKLVRDYVPDGLMLDNNEFYFAKAGWTCHCHACTAAFRKYAHDRCGDDASRALFGSAPNQFDIPSQEGPLFWFWVQWRNRVWADVLESFRARLRQLDPHIMLFANTQYAFPTGMLAADSQYVHEDVVLSETVGLASRQVSDKMVLGDGMAAGRPLWNYIGTFTNPEDYTGLKPAGVIGPAIAATIAHGARPWIVDGFDLGATDPIARQQMSRLLQWHAAHEELYQGRPWAGVATLISPISRSVRHRPLIPPHVSILREHGTPVIALRDDALTPDALRPFRVVTIETSDCLDGPAAATLVNWVRAGGTLIAAEDTGAWDSLGRANDVPTLRTALRAAGADLAQRVIVPKPGTFAQAALDASSPDSFRIDPASGVEVVPYLDGGSLILQVVRHDAATSPVTIHIPQGFTLSPQPAEWMTPYAAKTAELPITKEGGEASVVLRDLPVYGVVRIPLRH